MNTNDHRYWALIPAAGTGIRTGYAIPKQFVKLSNKRVIEWSISPLASHPRIHGVFVGIRPNPIIENWLYSLDFNISGVFEGAKTRAETILNGVNYMLERECCNDDWIIIHDSNRPFLKTQDIDHLIEAVGDNADGGLLTFPIRDTIKRGENGRALETIDRETLFLAQTPQMYKISTLRHAIQSSLEAGVEVTDDAQAMELQGYKPLLVKGSAFNLKLTTPQDFKLGTVILQSAGLQY